MLTSLNVRLGNERERERETGRLVNWANLRMIRLRGGAVCPCEGLFYFPNEVLMFRLTLAPSSAGGVIARSGGPRSLTHTASGRAPESVRSRVGPAGV